MKILYDKDWKKDNMPKHGDFMNLFYYDTKSCKIGYMTCIIEETNMPEDKYSWFRVIDVDSGYLLDILDKNKVWNILNKQDQFRIQYDSGTDEVIYTLEKYYREE